MARRDYLDEPNAPAANSIAVAASAFTRDPLGRILMIRRTDNDLYSIPGGQLEPGETLTQTVMREVSEETGVSVRVLRIIGIYSNPKHVIAYDDGEVRQEFSVCFRCELLGGELRVSEESREVLWVDPVNVSTLNIHPSTRLRIEHGLSDLKVPYFT